MIQMLFSSAVVVSAILSFVGFSVNLFIAVNSYKTWVESHRSPSSDQILFSLSITRSLMLGLFILDTICFSFIPNARRSVHAATFFLLCWIFFDSISLWFVTLLNVLYCVKISNLQYSLFLLLRRSLSSKTPRLLLACVLISTFTTLVHVVLRQKWPFLEFMPRRNGTEYKAREDILSLVISLSLSSSVQFLINVTSASLLIHSLRRHVQKMQSNASWFWSPQTEAYVGAMKLMVFFLLLYIPYSVASVFHYLPFSLEVDWGFRSTCMIVSSFYSPGHSVLIILTQPKLRSKAKQILCFGKFGVSVVK